MTPSRLILRRGLLAGAIVGLPLFGLAVALQGQPPSTGGMVLGFAIMLIAFSTIFVAVKQHRDRQLGGVIGFGPALLIGLGISAIATVCYVLAWEAALAWTGMDFAGAYSKAALAKAQAQGASAEALAQMAEELRGFQAMYAQPLSRMGLTATEIFPVGLLVSLVCAALLRNPRFLPAR